MLYLINTFLIPLLMTIVGIVIVLLIDRMRLPALEMLAGDELNTDILFPEGHTHAGERWRFFRVSVRNKQMPFFLKWLPRQTAENCRASIEFAGGSSILFSIRGRWSSTPDPPLYRHKGQELLKILYPDPVTIPCAKEELLDIVARCEGEEQGYAWNNEAYLEHYRPSNKKLEKGDYSIRVTVDTQNGKSFTQEFRMTIADSIERTSLKKSPSGRYG